MKRGEVWSVVLSPTKGSEQQGTTPAVIVSPDSMNETLETKVIVPLTSKLKTWPSRVQTTFRAIDGQAMCEQIRTISEQRLEKKLGELDEPEVVQIISMIRTLYGTL